MAEKVPIPPLATTAYTAKQIKKRKTDAEKKVYKKKSNKARDKTRVNINVAFQRWRELRELKGLKNDTALALLLLDRFEAGTANKEVSLMTVNDNEDVCVNVGCLLQLFQKCGKCRGVCVVTTQRKEDRQLSVCQWCSTCNQLDTWNSQPTGSVLPDSAASSRGACEEKGKPFAELEVTVEFESSSTDSLCSGEGEIIQEDLNPSSSPPLSNKEDEEEQYVQGDEEDDDSGVLEERLSIRDQSEFCVEQRFNPGDKDELNVQPEVAAAGMQEFQAQNEEKDWHEKKQEDADEDWCMDQEELETEDDSQQESDSDKEIQRKCSQPRKQNTGVDKVRKSTSMQLCPNCGVIYFTQTHKCKLNNVFSCSDCGRYFGSESSVTSHKMVCNGKGGQYRCVYCFEEFYTWLDKKQHEQSHSHIVKPYCCSECPQRFNDSFTRRRHLKEHHTKFACETCDKEFPRRHDLTRHALSHKNEKPFKCQVCGRAFAQGSQLKSHLRVHTGERPFKCPLCPMSFNHNVSKKNHMQSHNETESQSCTTTAVGSKPEESQRSSNRQRVVEEQ